MRFCAVVVIVLATTAAAIASAAGSAVPELFAEGIVSTSDDETGIALSPDARTAYFTKRSPTTNTPPRSVVCVTRRVGSRWSEPEIAPFSGVANDFGVAVSHDGGRIVFTSDRSAGGGASPNYDLWFVERDGEHWSEPRPLGDPVDTPATEAYPSLAADDTLYFSSSRPGGAGGSDLWRSRFKNGHYEAPENLADLDTPGYESQPAIAPDQRFIVFVASDRDDALKGEGAAYSRTDLYISLRDGERWTRPRRLDPPIDTPFNESGPSISPDGAWLYFASDRGFAAVPMPRMTSRAFERALHGTLNGWSNIYRVSTAALGASATQTSEGTTR